MDVPRLTYVPVYCYIEPEQVCIRPRREEAEKFVVRLKAALRKVAREETKGLRELVAQVVLPNYAAFLGLAELLREAGVQVAVGLHWSFPGITGVPEGEIRRNMPEMQVMHEEIEQFRKTGKATIEGKAQLLVELIPDHPRLGERLEGVRLPAGPVELPLLESNDPLDQFRQRRYLQLSLPSELGTYDLDEVQVQLSKQLGQVLHQLPGKIYGHIGQLLAQKDTSTKLHALGNAAETVLAGWQGSCKVEVDHQAKAVLSENIGQLKAIVAEETKCLEELVHFSEELASAFLTLHLTTDSEGRLQVILANTSNAPSCSVPIEIQDARGGVLSRLSSPSLRPLETVQLLNSEIVEKAVEDGARQLRLGNSIFPLLA